MDFPFLVYRLLKGSYTTCHIRTHIHTLIAEAAMQGADRFIRSDTALPKRPMIFLFLSNSRIHTHTPLEQPLEQFGVQCSAQGHRTTNLLMDDPHTLTIIVPKSTVFCFMTSRQHCMFLHLMSHLVNLNRCTRWTAMMNVLCKKCICSSL